MNDYSFPGLLGMIKRFDKFPSRYVDPHRVDVWLPEDYDPDTKEHYAVLYMMDGQNLFNPRYSRYSHTDWAIDETVTRLIKEGKIRKTIVVGIWSDHNRVIEYMPQKAAVLFEGVTSLRWLKKRHTISDEFLKFMVEELKPEIDEQFCTFPDAGSTFVMGSSMGGLISLYALCEHPQVFSGVGCVSTHFPIGDGVMLEYMKEYLPSPGKHKIYFDFGTGKMDCEYEPFQKQVDVILTQHGYRQGVDCITQKFIGHDHSEVYWRQRAHIPLEFLLGKPE